MITVTEKDGAVIITIESPSSSEMQLIEKAKNIQMVSVWERAANTAKKRWGVPVKKNNISPWKQNPKRKKLKRLKYLFRR